MFQFLNGSHSKTDRKTHYSRVNYIEGWFTCLRGAKQSFYKAILPCRNGTRTQLGSRSQSTYLSLGLQCNVQTQAIVGVGM